MNTVDLSDPAWYRALTLRERWSIQQGTQHAATGDSGTSEQHGRGSLRWREQAPFADAALFAQRLEQDGLDETALERILGAPIAALLEPADPPAWIEELASVLGQHEAARTPAPHNQALDRDPTRQLLVGAAPFLRWGQRRLLTGIAELAEQHEALPFEPQTIAHMVTSNLAPALFMMLNRTLVLELNVARIRGQLQGATASERFASFIERLQQADVLIELYREYPVLARQLLLKVKHAVDAALEFLDHLCRDWSELRSRLCPDHDPGQLIALTANAGDAHRGGRSVLIAAFSSGFRVVYKPRSLAVDVHFQELLAWLNERSALPPFRTLRIVERSTYGWVEFVAAAPCASSEEVGQFYQRQGAYLALLYTLEATDFHFENVIAAGADPVLIDIESLFHPALDERAKQQNESSLAYSVLRTGLLPQRFGAADEHNNIDISGLGGQGGQFIPARVPLLAEAGTDNMRVLRTQVEVPEAQNRPMLGGAYLNAAEHIPALAAGFSAMYRTLIAHREALLGAHGPIASFAHDTVRFIARATRVYGVLLQESFHPDVLRDGLERDRFFDRLWAGAAVDRALIRLIPAERHDLLHGDIPVFASRPSSDSLWTSTDAELPHALHEPPIESTRRRIRLLSARDLELQLWLVRATMATLRPIAEDAATARTHPAPRRRKPAAAREHATREHYLAAARAAGDRIAALALKEGPDTVWLGLSLADQRRWSVTPLHGDLYEGTLGIALFLGYLDAIAGEAQYTGLALEALAPHRRQLARGEAYAQPIGGFSGWGGVLYVLAHLGTLWRMPALLQEAEQVRERLQAAIEQDTIYDVIGGSAGAIGGLLSLYGARPTQRTLEVATQCGDWLLEQARSMETGIAWPFHLNKRRTPLAGMAHGSAGIAAALLELFAATGQRRFRQAALAAITYERSLFCAEAGNWRDLRDPELLGAQGREQSQFSVAWCHGAPGIGLARLQTLPILDDTAVRDEIAAAVRTTLARGFDTNHSLCHGALGNLELITGASRMLGQSAWYEQGQQRAASILASIRRRGWQCGVSLGVETPGLMTGIAGIGYGFLRLAEPERVPNVLQLEAPQLPKARTGKASR